MSKIKNGGSDQHCAEPFEKQQFGTAGVERVKLIASFQKNKMKRISSMADGENNELVNVNDECIWSRLTQSR